MSVYFDASILVSIFISDAFSDRATRFLAGEASDLIVSDFARAEFASALAKRIRVGASTREDVQTAFDALDVWASRFTIAVSMVSSDLRATEIFLRRLDTKLRTGDALNIAIAQRLGASLATFDETMAEAAEKMGVTLAAV